jgi:uroporphyrinogen-III synthase
MTAVAAYDSRFVHGPAPSAKELVLLFSPKGVASLARRITRIADHPLLAVGPTTAAAIEAHGFPSHGTLAEPTPASLADYLKACTILDST